MAATSHSFSEDENPRAEHQHSSTTRAKVIAVAMQLSTNMLLFFFPEVNCYSHIIANRFVRSPTGFLFIVPEHTSRFWPMLAGVF